MGACACTTLHVHVSYQSHTKGLHVAGDPSIETNWQRPLPSSPAPDGWVCWDLQLPESGRHVELIVHRGALQKNLCMAVDGCCVCTHHVYRMNNCAHTK